MKSPGPSLSIKIYSSPSSTPLFLPASSAASSPWLFGFDFDGTLANPKEGHRVTDPFFDTIASLKAKEKLIWGICTGRSLPFAREGMERADFPVQPDFLVTREREIFYPSADGQWTPDAEWNEPSLAQLKALLKKNEVTLRTAKNYVLQETRGQWVSHPDDPAGIVAEHPREIERVVSLFEACAQRCENLDYQRNSIYLRFSHKGYSKGTAVQYLQKKFEIPSQRTLVMGDNYNDLSMLNPGVATHFGSPSNGIPSLLEHLKKTGGFVAQSPYSEGVTEAIHRLVPVEHAS